MKTLTVVLNWLTHLDHADLNRIGYAAAGIGALTLALIARRHRAAMLARIANSRLSRRPTLTPATAVFYLVTVVSTAVSANTSWRFFGDVLKITDAVERSIMFLVVELTLLGCGLAMRAGVRSPARTPGPSRTVAWLVCGAAAYMALAESGPIEGVARVILGPLWAISVLHLTLGVEIRSVRGAPTGAWAKITKELRERFMSRLGLATDDRPAAIRTRDRAAERTARLATAKIVLFRRSRMNRAARVAGIALDAGQLGRTLGQVATYKHLADLGNLALPAPWEAMLPAIGGQQPRPDGHGQMATATPDGHPDPAMATDGNATQVDGQPALTSQWPPMATLGQLAPWPVATQRPATTRPTLAAAPTVAIDTAATVAAMLAANPNVTAEQVAMATGKADRTARRYLAEARSMTRGTKINGFGTPDDHHE